MEFGVAAFSTVAALVISKLGVIIEKKLKKDPEIRANVLFIKDDLEAIQDTIELHGHNREHTVLIAQLRRLAYDIEDCIDCFDANKTNRKDFASQIIELKNRSIATAERIQRFRFPTDGAARTTQGQGDPVVPIEVQNLGNYDLNCLLYLCLFPPNHDVRTKPLIRRWMAEGLVLGEQLAVDNLKVLTNSSIINSMSIQRSNNGKVKRCQPTDAMLKYISQQSMSENFILFCDGAAQLMKAQAARRLSVHPPANGELNLPQDLSRLRTLAVFADHANYEAVLDFSRYGVLRVLDLKECADLNNEHLTYIWKQVLMKYLSINLGRIDSITREIRHLDQLETLDLSGSEIVTVFKEVLLLPKLKHLFGKLQLSQRDSTAILGWALKKFLRNKSVLETLAGFATGGNLGFPQLMSRMRRLRKVKIWCESDASQKNLEAISRAITKFIREGTDEPDLTRSLSIELKQCSGEFLNTIHTNAGKLASLKLHGNLSRFPQFVGQLRGVSELCLWSTGLSWVDILVGLSNLGILKYLKLIEDKLNTIEIESQHLKSIERLSFVSNTALDITILTDALLHLVSLHIICEDLHVIPGTPGIEITHMKALKEVALHPQVKDNIKGIWEDAASSHDNKPDLLLIEGP